jgi:hypothetical protein
MFAGSTAEAWSRQIQALSGDESSDAPHEAQLPRAGPLAPSDAATRERPPLPDFRRAPLRRLPLGDTREAAAAAAHDSDPMEALPSPPRTQPPALCS